MLAYASKKEDVRRNGCSAGIQQFVDRKENETWPMRWYGDRARTRHVADGHLGAGGDVLAGSTQVSPRLSSAI